MGSTRRWLQPRHRSPQHARPGQFVHLLAGEGPLVPAAASVLHPVGGARGPGSQSRWCSTLVGAPGTGALAGLRPPTWSTALGPLGRAFDPPENAGGLPCWSGGGCVAAALFFLATELRRAAAGSTFVIGAATSPPAADAMEAERLGHSLTVTTDDDVGRQRGLVDRPPDPSNAGRPRGRGGSTPAAHAHAGRR